MGVAVFAPPRCADFSAPNAGIEIGPSSVTTASIMAIAFRGGSDFSKLNIGPPSLILPVLGKAAGRRRTGYDWGNDRLSSQGCVSVKKDSQPNSRVAADAVVRHADP